MHRGVLEQKKGSTGKTWLNNLLGPAVWLTALPPYFCLSFHVYSMIW